VISAENIGRCPKCNQFLVGEERASHICKLRPERWVEEIYFNGITDSSSNEDQDQVRVGFGLDGKYYRLVVCKHSPPHSLKSRWLTGKDESRQGNSTLAEILYTGFFTCSNNVKLNVRTRYSSRNFERGNSAVNG
jgi:hypothetical protein